MSRSTVRLLPVLVSAAALVVGIMAPAAMASDTPGQDSKNQPVAVHVPMHTITSPGAKGMNGLVEIRLGNSKPFAVMLDTGSVGLRVFPGAWDTRPRGVAVSKTKVTVPATGGQSTKGFVARAPFTIGGVTTTTSVAFQYVNTESPYIGLWARKAMYGILGIGTGSYLLPNPLSALPGTVGQHWSVHLGGDPATRRPGGGALILGAEIPKNAAANFTLPPLGPNTNGALLWDDHKANGCWRFGRTPERCVDTWFDSGFDVMRVKGAVFSGVPRTPAHAVKTGTPVTLAAGGSSFTVWKFAAGTTQSLDFVRMIPSGRPAINTGNALFFQYTVTYDVEHGLVSLSRPSAS